MVDKTFLHRDNESGGRLVHGEPSVDVFSWSSCRTNVNLFLVSKGPRLLTFSDNNGTALLLGRAVCGFRTYGMIPVSKRCCDRTVPCFVLAGACLLGSSFHSGSSALNTRPGS